MYYCIPVVLTLCINVYDFIFGKQQNSFTKREMLLKLMTYISQKNQY